MLIETKKSQFLHFLRVFYSRSLCAPKRERDNLETSRTNHRTDARCLLRKFEISNYEISNTEKFLESFFFFFKTEKKEEETEYALHDPSSLFRKPVE